ncbi:MAG: methyltransferase domain-containing protein [Halioglobus sp.]
MEKITNICLTGKYMNPAQEKSKFLRLLLKADKACKRKDFTRAEKQLNNLVELYPDMDSVLHKLGLLLCDLGRYQEAIGYFERALGLDPKNSLYHYDYGRCLFSLYKTPAALNSFVKALYCDRKNNNALTTVKKVLMIAKTRTQWPKESYSALSQLMLLYPDNEGLRMCMAQVLKLLNFVAIAQEFPRFISDLIDLLDKKYIAAKDFTFKVQDLLFSEDSFKIHSGTLLATPENIPLSKESLYVVISHPLLLPLLRNMPIVNPTLEIMLSRIRRHYLAQSLSKESDVIDERVVFFLSNFGQQMWLNEYVYYCSEEEQNLLAQLRIICQSSTEFDRELLAQTLVFYCYCAVQNDSSALQNVLQHSDDASLSMLIQQNKNYLREQELRSKVESTTVFSNKVSLKVRDQYEHSPYPRWSSVNRLQQPTDLNGVVKEQLPHLLDLEHLSPSARILIAGCGTGVQALGLASTVKAKEIVAVDLSAASLAYGMRMAEELNVKNIRFLHADILELDDKFDQPFDFIACTGVLHHLENPMAGWRVLNGLLRPGGLIFLAFYSRAARKIVRDSRAVIAEQGLGSTPEDMREFRNQVLHNPRHKLRNLLNIGDFYTLSECRDLLFHVQEHQHTLPELQKNMSDLGLEFLGFDSSSLKMDAADRACLTSAENAGNIAKWHEYELENLTLFLSMYTFYCKKL